MATPAQRSTIGHPVFLVSAGLLVAFLAFGVLAPKHASTHFGALLEGVATTFGWLYVVATAGFVLFCLWLLLSRHGRIRLGGDDEHPEFKRPTWFAMLFSAGMGIGLVFYGVAEPMLHYAAPPNAPAGSAAAAAQALPITLFHWGLHAWAIYILMALGIAYFAYRHGLPLAVRSCLYPLLGERIHGPIGHLVDIVAVFGTLFGLATSLGVGAMQVSAGLERLFGLPHGIQTQLWLIAIITGAATLSLVTGMKRGIRRLSELNLVLATLLMIFVLVVGPTVPILESLVHSLGGYARELLTRSVLVAGSTETETQWLRDWTVFYWGWWIAWAPFVGTFVARVSRGRTIRELILGALFVPVGVTFVWFSVFGGTALHLERSGPGGIAQAVSSDLSTAVYVLLEHLPLSGITSVLTTVVVLVFFVTSSDSASFVVDMLTSGGHPNPPVWQRVFWAVAEGACAAVLLYAGGQRALEALRAAVVSIGLPFCLVLIATAISLVRALRQEGLGLPPARS